MPLIKSKSEKAFHTNIREMVKAGHPVKQAAAAAYREARSDVDPHGVRAYHDACARGDTAAQLGHKFGR